MKVLLIFPNRGVVTGEPPIGLGYIAACLRQKQVAVDLLDMTFAPSFARAQRVMEAAKPDIVGIYASTVMLKDSYAAARLARQCSAKLVVLGGPHASVLPEETLRAADADALVAGEGEWAFTEIAERFRASGGLPDLRGIPGVYVKIQGQVTGNSERRFIKDLDTLPLPARDLFDMRRYGKHWFQLDGAGSNLVGTNIVTSRGCPFSCSFCQPTLQSVFGAPHRRRSPENIVKELAALKAEYGLSAVQIVDDLFFIDSAYIEAFCRQMLESKLGIVWGAQSRVDTVPDDRLLDRAYRAGLRLISLGIESGASRVIKLYDKRIHIDQVNAAVDRIRAHRIKTRGFFIIGAPTESIAEIKQTIDFAVASRLDEAAFSVLTPLPGTHIHALAKANGWEVTQDWGYEHYYAKGGFLSGALPESVIRRYQRLAFLRFYLHPSRAPYLLNSLLSPRRAVTKLKCYFT